MVLLPERLQFIAQFEPGGCFPLFGFDPSAFCLLRGDAFGAFGFGGGLPPGVFGGADSRDLLGACERGGGWFVRAVGLDGSGCAAGG